MDWAEDYIAGRTFIRGPDGKWWIWFNSRYPYAMAYPTPYQRQAQRAFDHRPDRRLGPDWQMEVYP